MHGRNSRVGEQMKVRGGRVRRGFPRGIVVRIQVTIEQKRVGTVV